MRDRHDRWDVEDEAAPVVVNIAETTTPQRTTDE